ncbi:MAG: response regulator [Kofleriaceae bacterium]
MITILHTGQTGVERGADRAARAVGFKVGGFCQFDYRDEVGQMPPHIAADLTASPTRGSRAAWQPTLACANVLVTIVPERTAAISVTGFGPLRALATKGVIPVIIVDTSSDLEAVARELRLLEIRHKNLNVMIFGPRRTRWADGEALAWQLITRLSLVPGIDTRRVLVVDDDLPTAQALSRLLSLLGHESKAALTGEQALACARTMNPDIAILDIGLDDMTGYDVARQLRRDQTGPLFLVAITGRETGREPKDSLAAGFDQHVVKPANLDVMQQLLSNAAARLDVTSQP